MQPSPLDDKGNASAYELGRMAEALAQNTRALTKLHDSVEDMAAANVRYSNRLTSIEAHIESIQCDLRKTVNLSMIGHSNESDIRARMEYLDRIYKADQDKQGMMRHAKKAAFTALAIAFMWWGIAVFKDALIKDIAIESRHYPSSAQVQRR